MTLNLYIHIISSLCRSSSMRLLSLSTSLLATWSYMLSSSIFNFSSASSIVTASNLSMVHFFRDTITFLSLPATSPRLYIVSPCSHAIFISCNRDSISHMTSYHIICCWGFGFCSCSRSKKIGQWSELAEIMCCRRT
jgi:hypothetical protein